MKKKSQIRGFTLVELLVVIAIIVVLVAMLVPLINGALKDANRSGCQANLKSIGTAFLEHSRAHNNTFPRLHGSAGDLLAAWQATDTVDGVSHTAMNLVWVLIADGRVPTTGFKCPADTDYAMRITASKYGWTNNSEFSFGMHFHNDKGMVVADGSASGTPNPADPADSTYNPYGIVMTDKSPVEINKALLPNGEPDTGVSGSLNHKNHKSDGLAYLTKSGNVSFLDDSDGSTSEGDELYKSNTPDTTLTPNAVDDVLIVSDPA